MHLYQLTYCWWEDKRQHLLSSEQSYTADEWDKICRDALNKASQQPFESWIGWDDLVDEAIKIILSENSNIELISPIGFRVWGGTIISDDDNGISPDKVSSVLDPTNQRRIVDHNMALRNKSGKLSRRHYTDI